MDGWSALDQTWIHGKKATKKDRPKGTSQPWTKGIKWTNDPNRLASWSGVPQQV